MIKNTPAVVKGYRLPLFGLFAVRFGNKPVVIEIKPQGDQVNSKEAAVENKVRRPAHAAQYAAAGAGHLRPVTQFNKGYITCEKNKQGQGRLEAGQQGPVKQKQCCGSQFCKRQQVQQHIRNPARERLPVKFPPECPDIGQLACSSVDEKQYQKGDWQ